MLLQLQHYDNNNDNNNNNTCNLSSATSSPYNPCFHRSGKWEKYLKLPISPFSTEFSTLSQIEIIILVHSNCRLQML